MRLSLKVNGISRFIASCDGPGFLGAHLNLHERPKENDYSKRIRVGGTQTLETETVRFDWPEIDLQIRDIVELQLLDDGEGDAPSAVRRSSELAGNLFSQQELAREVLSLVGEFEGRLMRLVNKSEKAEPAHEHKRFTNAVANVLVEIGNRLLYPIYRRHKNLVPDELKGELL
jgi:hypothetical protein